MLRAWNDYSWLFLIPVAVGAVGTIGVMEVFGNKSPDVDDVIETIEDRNSEVAAYMVTYLMPFVVAPTARWQDWTATLLFITLLFILYVATDLLAVNPLLALCGWRRYRAKTTRHGYVWFLAPRGVQAGQATQATEIYDTVYLRVGRQPGWGRLWAW